MEKEELDFNFWPSFADLMLSLTLILLLIMFLFVGIKSIGTINLQTVKRNQLDLIDTIALGYQSKAVKIEEDRYGISLNDRNRSEPPFDIEIRNEQTLQRLTFSDRILFAPDDYNLSGFGPDVMSKVGQAIQNKIAVIREIQIQGHADIDHTNRFPSNVHLAALRAIEVFEFLQNDVGINPSEHLMSATSFGEYKPVLRNDALTRSSDTTLAEQNSTPNLKARNRRIELLLFYTFENRK